MLIALILLSLPLLYKFCVINNSFLAKKNIRMIVKLKYVFWAISILLSYPLYSLGQIYLFISKQKATEFYDLLNRYPNEWIITHIILLTSLVLLVPAFIGLCSYFKNTQSYNYILLSTLFIILSIFPLFGQFTIDLCFIEIFKLPKEIAYQTLDKIQNNTIVNSLFYNNAKLFFLLKYADLTLIGQIFLGIALLLSKKVPAWAKFLFVIALLLTQLGILIDPYYGRVIKRLSYSLISISLLPIVITILKWNATKIKIR